jgi:hypothetical protein
MALDPRIILGLRPLASPAELQDDRARREIANQEIELRRQDIDLRRQALQQRGIGQPKPFDPKGAMEEMNYRFAVGQKVHDQLVQAQAHPEAWPIIKSNIAQIAGPEAAQSLPEEFDQAFVDTHVASWPQEVEKAKVGTPQMVEVPDPDDPTKTIRKVVVLKEGDSYPGVPKPVTAASTRPVLVETIENGKRVRKFVTPREGDSFPVPAASGGGSGASSSQLADAVMANPAVFKTLTPTAQTALIPELSKRGFDFKAAGAGAIASEDERKSAGFYTQMNSAIKTLESVESKLTDKELYQIQSLPQEDLIGMINRNQLSENAKRYLRAFEQFTEARLRPVSGAAISDSEYARDRRTYARQYGETPTLAKERREARHQALGTLKMRAGRAFTEPVDDDAAGSTDVGDWIDAGNGLRIRKKK